MYRHILLLLLWYFYRWMCYDDDYTYSCVNTRRKLGMNAGTSGGRLVLNQHGHDSNRTITENSYGWGRKNEKYTNTYYHSDRIIIAINRYVMLSLHEWVTSVRGWPVNYCKGERPFFRLLCRDSNSGGCEPGSSPLTGTPRPLSIGGISNEFS